MFMLYSTGSGSLDVLVILRFICPNQHFTPLLHVATAHLLA